MRITIGVVDDERLFMKGLSALIDTFPSCTTVLEAINGQDLQTQMEVAATRPEILLMDVNMPLLDGPGAVRLIRKNYPLVRMVALSLKDDDATIIRMIKEGCCAYLCKSIHPVELEKALVEVYTKGYYNADLSNLRARDLLAFEQRRVNLSDREIYFVSLSCSDLTYKQIAAKMGLSDRTIDGYRDSVFEKLGVSSRTGMVLEAIRKRLVAI
jgi:DNA-binding NarL/FixJ family response regulator